MGCCLPREDVLLTLKDAGCSPQAAESILEMLLSGSQERGLKLLAEQRRALLEEIHRRQRCLDCLDYLVYRIQKSPNSEAFNLAKGE